MNEIIYIFSSGILKRKQNTIYFEGGNGEKRFVPVEITKEIHIFGEVTLNKDVLEFFTQKEIILHFYNYYEYYIGSFYPREHYNSGYMILNQARHYLDENLRLQLAKKFVKGASQNIKKVLNYYNKRKVDLSTYIEKIDLLQSSIDFQEGVDALMAIEGNIHEVYYSAFDDIISSEDFSFGERSRRPPKNRINALISFGNSLMYTTVLSEIYKTHLDPRIGFLHATNFRRFSLNLDVAEIFKPIIVDRVIFTLLNKSLIKSEHFDNKLQGIYLRENGAKVFVQAFDERLKSTISHKTLGRNVSYRTLIRIELYKIEKHLMEEKEYEPFVSEW